MNERGADSELGVDRGRKPRSIWLPLVDDIKANIRNIRSQQAADHKGKAPRQPGG